MSKQLAVAVTWMLAACSAFASEERAIEVAQPIVTEDAIYLSRVTLVTYKGFDHNGLPWDRVYERALVFFRDALH